MITKFKLYESINIGEPEVGDYVLCHLEEDDSNEQKITSNFLNKNIGILVKIDKNKDKFEVYDNYKVKFDEEFDYYSQWNNLAISFDNNLSSVEFDDDHVNNVASFYLDEIDHWSKNKEDLEHIVQAKKYNL